MTTKAPPVPEENRSPKGPGNTDADGGSADQATQGQADFDKQGQPGSATSNTSHQGYQQDC